MSSIQKNFYAVKRGHNVGIYYNWADCKAQTEGYSNPKYRKFSSMEDATNFLKCSEADEKKYYTNTPKKVDTSKYLEKYKDNIESNVFSSKVIYKVSKWNFLSNEFFIFTDGSCKKKPDGTTTSGLGVYLGEECCNIKEIYNDKTNNQCELLAIDIAFKIILKCINEVIKHNKKINIVSDSEYSIKCASLWISKWKDNNWKTASGGDVKNKSIICSIDKSMNTIREANSKLPDTHKVKVKLIHVNSHQVPKTHDSYNYFLWKGNLIVDGLAQNMI